VNTVYTARDVREAERSCRGRAADLDRMADELVRHAPPVAVDRAGNAHATRLASVRRREAVLLREAADISAEYAAELEREQGAGSKPTRGKSSLLTSRPERTADPMRVGVGLGWCSS
jgi:hypothetical protein